MEESFAKQTDQTELKPFENIALSFSGGGFRAAAFSLGVLSYLNKIMFTDSSNLLSKVSYISSTSGGTITAAYYTLCSSKPGFDFNDFYKTLKEFMKADKLLLGALEILNKKELWPKDREGKSHNLINSFSIFYDQYLFNKATIGDIIPDHSHLKEVCFNATEFFKGHSFRFQFIFNNYKSQLTFGNYYIKIREKKIINKIKLADCLAASSCFPAGFEPLIFPTDFISENLSLTELENNVILRDPYTLIENKLLDYKTKSVGLMDGGITDNQSIRSMVEANGRREGNKEAFQLMLVCDVSSHYMDPYISTSQQQNGFFYSLNLQKLKWIFLAFFICTIPLPILLSALGLKITQLAIISMTAVGTVSVIFWLLYFYIKSTLFGKSALFNKKKIKEDTVLNLGEIFSSDVVGTLSEYLNKTKFGVLSYMFKSRVTSILTLSNDVFLKRVRKLIYDSFYEAEPLKYRQKSITIYDLSITNDHKIESYINNKLIPYLEKMKINVDIEKMKPTLQIKEIAEKAFKMETTLWFNKDQSINDKAVNDIIATGQFTTCYNLLDYIINLKNSTETLTFNSDVQNVLNHIQNQLITDWLKFTNDPYFLIKNIEIK
ncbi:MAG: patatin-like phospholipase family protein [Saprospiraceae bacterium]|uniref:Patatin-like phospholipase family protein n=1 Tax=Candidatus Opimibacter skivensis TaxID=2982028 RepID=A0A9D7SX69_9BACT|nr:patatin-like phospholipase family protein [Candidatus Opimibacter skivensis]